MTRDRTPSRHGLTESELQWVHDYGAWWSSEYATVNRALNAAAGATDVHQLVRPFAALRGCEASYERVAGDAPGSLSSVEDESMKACSAARRAAGLVGVDRYVPNAQRQTALTDTLTALISADRALVARLVLSKSLPTEEQPTAESRIDARYSQAASNVTAFNLEVRCWSRADWAAIQREAAALGAETSRKFFGAAEAFEGVANLSPRTCETLDELAYERRPANLRNVVEALLTLGRESEHGAGEGAAAEAQCDALQDVRPLAIALGSPRAEANGFAQHAWDLYRTKRIDPQRWTAACRNDGPFDKNGTDVWP